MLSHVTEKTLFIIASKTFTTQRRRSTPSTPELRLLTRRQRGRCAFAAVSTAEQLADDFGSNRMSSVLDGGGRYSLTSAAGLSTMLAIGPLRWRTARRCSSDGHHSRDTGPPDNAPVLMGLCAVWNRNFFRCRRLQYFSECDLAQLPAYLQRRLWRATATGEN